jgi:TATA-binding protein-associated factor Taf7
MPEDGRTLARANLNELKGKIEVTLKDGDKNLEPFTKAHLEESLARINQALEVQLQKKF